jgi:hypothetical protein
MILAIVIHEGVYNLVEPYTIIDVKMERLHTSSIPTCHLIFRSAPPVLRETPLPLSIWVLPLSLVSGPVLASRISQFSATTPKPHQRSEYQQS